jgi:hypothetical protein
VVINGLDFLRLGFVPATEGVDGIDTKVIFENSIVYAS